MKKNKNIIDELKIEVYGKELDLFKINRDVNGNPRYIISFDLISNDKSEAINLIKEIGGKMYKADNNFLVFQSYNVRADLEVVFKELESKNNSINRDEEGLYDMEL